MVVVAPVGEDAQSVGSVRWPVVAGQVLVDRHPFGDIGGVLARHQLVAVGLVMTVLLGLDLPRSRARAHGTKPAPDYRTPCSAEVLGLRDSQPRITER